MNPLSWLQVTITGINVSVAVLLWSYDAPLWLCILVSIIAFLATGTCLSAPTKSAPYGSPAHVRRYYRSIQGGTGTVALGIAYGLLRVILLINPVANAELPWWQIIILVLCGILFLICAGIGIGFLGAAIIGISPQSKA